MNRKKTFTSIIVAVISALWGISGTLYAEEITVSAAVSLKNAFEEIAKQLEKTHAGQTVSFNFGASGDLVKQIEGGAPVDVFASAAQKDMDEIEKRGLVAPGSRVDFAKNSIVLIQPSASAVAVSSFQDLCRDEVRKIALGNPASVPAGRYAKEVFENFKLFDRLQSKLIYAENVRQVLDYVARNEVDAGIVYSTDAMMREKDIRVICRAPAESHSPVTYPMAAVAGTRHEKAARGFIEFALSQDGKKILQKYGFKPIP